MIYLQSGEKWLICIQENSVYHISENIAEAKREI